MPRNEDTMEKDLMQSFKNWGTNKMKRMSLLLVAVVAAAMLVNCRAEFNDYYDPLPTYETRLVSDIDADGDIAFSLPDNLTVSSAATTGSVLAGVDPASEDEYRGFLAFPLRDAQGVPLYADIESATLEIYISNVDASSPGAAVPLIFDLVSFSPPTLIAADFDRAPLLTLYGNDIYADDVGYFLSFDVTPLMIEAQRRDLTYFQIRILLDGVLDSSGIVEIDDDLATTAPLLTVTYY